MLDNLKEKLEDLENIGTNFQLSPSNKAYMKQKLINKITKEICMKFEFIMVAMSKNGGLMALCKTAKFKESKAALKAINDNIIVIHQDSSKTYLIPIDWDYKTSYIVSIGFTDLEQLYAFCNDGSMYKIDILLKKAVKKPNSAILLNEGIEKVKLFEKGFIAMTKAGKIYYIPEIKDPKPIFMINIKEQLGFTNEVDFLGISKYKSKSDKFELVILNQTGNGILHVTMQDSADIKNGKNPPVEIFMSDKLEPYPSEKEGKIGKINAMCISPSGSEIALLCAEKAKVYVYPVNFDKKHLELELNLKKLNPDLEDDEVADHKNLFSYKKKYQFLFCGKEAVALCGERFITVINKKSEIISFRAIEELPQFCNEGEIPFICVQEVDGIRYFSTEGISLVSPVPKELFDTCYAFSSCPAKTLLEAYCAYLSQNADCDKSIREIANQLPSAIENLQIAAVNLFYTKEINEHNAKDLQMLLMKAAQYGKSFVQVSDFSDYNAYIDRCKALRVINSLRNMPSSPRILTYEEYLNLDPYSVNDFLKKILRTNEYEFAYELWNYLGYDTDKVYQKFCVSNIKLIDDDFKVDRSFEIIHSKLLESQNISYIYFAEKCIKYGKYRLAEKFLEQEKSIVVKVPQYLKLKKWNKALELAIASNDRTVIKVVIDKIFKVEEPDFFVKIVGEHNRAHKAIIEYLKTHDQDKPLRLYLGSKGDNEELFYMTIENFFRCKTIKDRKEYLKEAKLYLDNIKGNPNLDFYKTYIKDLENSLKFKSKCIGERKIIQSNDISPFDNSIFECYKLGIQSHYDWIEKENKNFNIGQKKITYIRFRKLAELKRYDEIAETIKKVGYKKLEITPLGVAKILMEFERKEEAYNYIKEVIEPNDFTEKINLLKKMDKHKEALEIMFSEKKVDKQLVIDMANSIIKEKPDLKGFLDSLLAKK